MRKLQPDEIVFDLKKKLYFPILRAVETVTVAKNIILLSDGTGNSAAKPFKTNVWRIYQAIDLDPQTPRQVVFYSEGVGTENFKPLKLLGLSLGIGVAASVVELYKFLCRNYETEDRIFLFGFSRGAFTVRLLAGLIMRCGLVLDPSNERELKDWVDRIYNEYKRDVAIRRTAARPFLVVGQIWKLKRRLCGHKAHDDKILLENIRQEFPNIAFIGVWDTVDAYGMPIHELKVGIDKLIWPMTFADLHLPDRVDRACHALSLDDERLTFRPVLWSDPANDPDRLTQVWFAGVHANVGGGYPDDGLSYVALQWMMDEAKAAGLRFHQADVESANDRSNPHGKQHDSRSGVAGYYRYGPRNVQKLCREAQIRQATIHASAEERIRQWHTPYAPVSLPAEYDVVGRGTNMPLTPVRRLESSQQAAQRMTDMRWVGTAVFQRRAAYFLTVFLTLFLATFPFWDRFVFPRLGRLAWVPFWLSDWLEIGGSWVQWAFGFIGVPEISFLLSSFASWWSFFANWLSSFANFPAVFLISVSLLLWLFFRKSQQLQNKAFERAEEAWRRVWE